MPKEPLVAIRDIVVYGAAGHATVLLRGIQEGMPGLRPVAFVDDFTNGHTHPDFGVPVISDAERVERFAELPVLLAVNAPSRREALATRVTDSGSPLFTYAGNPVSVSSDARIGEGSLVNPRGRIGPRVRVGRGVALLGDLIAHDVTIGDFSTVGPTASVLGHVRIGDRVNIAPGAIVSNGSPGRDMVVGDDVVIGVGAVVTRPVAAGEVVVGNPAMPVARWRALQRLLDEHS